MVDCQQLHYLFIYFILHYLPLKETLFSKERRCVSDCIVACLLGGVWLICTINCPHVKCFMELVSSNEREAIHKADP